MARHIPSFAFPSSPDSGSIITRRSLVAADATSLGDGSLVTMAAMRLTAWEEERLLVFSAAELARRHRTAGLALNAPEAIALICDAMLEAARAGAAYADVEAAGLAAVTPDEILDGVRELVDEVRLEVLVGDGTRLVLLVDPLGGGRPPADNGPGAIEPGGGDEERAGTARERRTISVRNDSTRVVRVSSHFPFERVNARLSFDRSVAGGFRLDLPAGTSERWAPGETREVALVRYRGAGGEP
jgi:urease subunit gamma/beta